MNPESRKRTSAISVLSDLHVESERDPSYGSLIAWLGSRAPGSDIVLAGDIFDLWVSDKKVFRERYEDFLRALDHAVSKGSEVHYVEGNHDFFLKDLFESRERVQVHSERVEFECSGKRLRVEHGDLANSSDYAYRGMRAFFRSAPFHAFVKHAPDRWIEAIGDFTRKESRERNALLPDAWGREKLAALRKIYHAYAEARFRQGVDWLVLGHCHDFDAWEAQIDGRACFYWNNGFPKAHRSFLHWDESLERPQWREFA